MTAAEIAGGGTLGPLKCPPARLTRARKTATVLAPMITFAAPRVSLSGWIAHWVRPAADVRWRDGHPGGLLPVRGAAPPHASQTTNPRPDHEVRTGVRERRSGAGKNTATPRPPRA